MRVLLAVSVLLFAHCRFGADAGWKPLFNGKNLDGWETRGECLWTVLPDGVLLGQRSHPRPSTPFSVAWPVDQKQFSSWLYRQAWLYTSQEFGQFDLHVEYFIPPQMNSGISIRDRSRAHDAIGEADSERPDLAKFPKTTPAHIGYEIQIIDQDAQHLHLRLGENGRAAPRRMEQHGYRVAK